MIVERNKFFFICLAGLLLLSMLLPACSTSATGKVKVVTCTSLLAYIAEQIGGDKIEVTNLIPPVQHPGNFNVRPGDVETLARARLFLVHGWPGEGFVDKFVESADNAELLVYEASVEGNWMTPPVQTTAADKVAVALGQVDAAQATFYESNAAAYKKRVAAKEAEVKAKLAGANVTGVNVIAAAMQADFLKWAGLNVVATYAGPNALNPQLVKELVDQGRAAGVGLVVDNLQNGKDAGRGIAEELKGVQVNLSNFPGGFENTETWEKAIDKNIQLLIGVISEE